MPMISIAVILGFGAVAGAAAAAEAPPTSPSVIIFQLGDDYGKL